MIKVFIQLSMILLPYGLLAQTIVGSVDPSSSGVSVDNTPGGLIQDMKFEEPKLIGTTFIEDEWFRGSLTLINGHEMEDYLLKYDIANYSILINEESEREVKSLSGLWVDRIEWYNHQTRVNQKYVNAHLLGSGIKNSFVEVIFEDEQIILVSDYTLKVVRGAYIAAIDIGDRDSKITKVKKYYFVKNKEFILIPKSKKKLASLFVKAKLSPFLKEKKIDIKSEEDLIKVIKYLGESLH